MHSVKKCRLTSHMPPCTFHALPARPTWTISLVLCSSLRSVGQLAPSSFTSASSSFVPIILYFELAVSICPKSGISVVCLLLSPVGKSKLTDVGEENSMTARSLSIFFRKRLAITVVGVW